MHRTLWKRFSDTYFYHELQNFFRKGDIILLILCLFITGFSCLVLSSVGAPRVGGATRLIIIQAVAALLGVFAYAIFSSVDLDFFSEHRIALTVISLGFLAMLIPFGTDNGSGNRSWLNLPLVPFDIQPAEIIKITFVLILASIMNTHQDKISSVPSVLHMVLPLGLIVGVNMALSRDLGVSLIFVFIFIVMAFIGGVKLIWFLIGGGALAVVIPFVWPRLENYQRERILVVFDPTVDPTGMKARWHFRLASESLTGGGMTGQGLYSGTRTQAGALPAQHTDFIFSAIGEELGFLGCLMVLILMLLLVARCIQVGLRSRDYMRRMVCFGVAAALVFQVLVNVGMNLGVVPVIGLTLPLVSYGGSSTLSLYAMLGLVSGVYARPSPRTHNIYIQPPR